MQSFYFILFIFVSYFACIYFIFLFLYLYLPFCVPIHILGKGDLVGCDISMHLAANSNGQGGQSSHNSAGTQDVLVKSSSDVKVSDETVR